MRFNILKSVAWGLSVMIVTVPCAIGNVYGYVGPHGTIHLTNLAQHTSQYKYVMSTAVYQTVTGIPQYGQPVSAKMFDPIILHDAAKYDVPVSLVKAVIMTESAFNPDAVSPKGAQGLMQLMPSTAYKFDVSNPFNPAQNIAAGVQYLSELIHQFHNTSLAVAAYNAGPDAVERYNDSIPPYPQTQAYVPTVLRYRQHYATH